MLRPYVQVVRTPGVSAPLIASFVGALPIGMLSLAVLLLLRLQTGSFLSGGVMAALLGLGNAAGLTVQGACIDRWGQTVGLIPASVACLSALVVLVISATHRGPLMVVAASALVAGAAIPATPSCMRGLLPTLVDDPQLRSTAYALFAVTHTAATIAGPLLVSGFLLVGGPAVAVLGAAGFAGCGGVLFASTPASRHWVPVGRRQQRAQRSYSGGMRTLIVGNAALGVIAGLIGVVVPAVALTLGAASYAGVFSAASALGELFGGAAYGGRRWSSPLTSRLVVAQCCSAIACAGLALAVGSVPAMIAMMVAVGITGAVPGIATTTLLDAVAPPGALTASYAVMVSAGIAASSAGYVGGGLLVGVLSEPTLFVISAGIGVAVVGWFLVRRRTLTQV